jgi:3-methyladenine DNA glycosylase Tag
MRSRTATPTAAFRPLRAAARAVNAVGSAFESLDNFIIDFADSAREVNRAMERARSQRHTISAYRR